MKDGSTGCIVMKDIKYLYPVELDEYSISTNTYHELQLAWWIT